MNSKNEGAKLGTKYLSKDIFVHCFCSRIFTPFEGWGSLKTGILTCMVRRCRFLNEIPTKPLTGNTAVLVVYVDSFFGNPDPKTDSQKNRPGCRSAIRSWYKPAWNLATFAGDDMYEFWMDMNVIYYIICVCFIYIYSIYIHVCIICFVLNKAFRKKTGL